VELCKYDHKSSVRAVKFSCGERMILTVNDSQFNSQPSIFIFNVDTATRKDNPAPVRTLCVEGDKSNILAAQWGAINRTVISGHDDGTLRVWDVMKGKVIKKVQAHAHNLRDVQLSKDGTMIITAGGADQEAKLWDAETLDHLKTYEANRPINSAALSPIFNHAIIAGGQEARDVTTTANKMGNFDALFYHAVYADYMGSIKGHFGPVNSIAIHPEGKSFTTGGEDGYIRLHHFEKSYFNGKHNFY